MTELGGQSHAPTHWPTEHTSTLLHRLPQVPQLVESVCVSVQRQPGPQLVRPWLQPHAHVPFAHHAPCGHARRQAPQWFGSELTSTQKHPGPQIIIPGEQSQAHEPLRQTAPKGHALPQLPQFELSSERFTHEAPHCFVPGLHGGPASLAPFGTASVAPFGPASAAPSDAPSVASPPESTPGDDPWPAASLPGGPASGTASAIPPHAASTRSPNHPVRRTAQLMLWPGDSTPAPRGHERIERGPGDSVGGGVHRRARAPHARRAGSAGGSRAPARVPAVERRPAVHGIGGWIDALAAAQDEARGEVAQVRALAGRTRCAGGALHGATAAVVRIRLEIDAHAARPAGIQALGTLARAVTVRADPAWRACEAARAAVVRIRVGIDAVATSPAERHSRRALARAPTVDADRAEATRVAAAPAVQVVVREVHAREAAPLLSRHAGRAGVARVRHGGRVMRARVRPTVGRSECRVVARVGAGLHVRRGVAARRPGVRNPFDDAAASHEHEKPNPPGSSHESHPHTPSLRCALAARDDLCRGRVLGARAPRDAQRGLRRTRAGAPSDPGISIGRATRS
jgi:hypothetical protein